VVEVSKSDWEKILKALANKRRLTIVALLRSEGELSVGELSRKIELAFRSTSKHLWRMFNAGILEREERKGETFYFLNPRLSAPVRRIIETVLGKG